MINREGFSPVDEVNLHDLTPGAPQRTARVHCLGGLLNGMLYAGHLRSGHRRKNCTRDYSVSSV